jgi:hypothetical protein
MRDPLIKQFIGYIAQRGVPQHFHELYRNEAAAILSRCGVGAIDQLDPQDLTRVVNDAEKRLKNRQAVVAALEAFLRHWRRPPDEETSDAIPDSMVGSPAVITDGGEQHRRFVRVPFNREIDVVGSLGGNRASDISMGGLYLETRSAWNFGDVVDVNFRLRAADRQPLHMSARVVYVDPGVGVGLDFVDPPPEARRAIRRYVEDMVARREHARS